MTFDVENELRDHFRDAEQAHLRPGSWERLEDRLAQADRRPPRHRLLGVAALVLVAGIITVVAVWTRGDGTQTVRVGHEPEVSSTTARPTTSAVATTTSMLAAPAGPQTIAVIIDPDGDGRGDVALLNPATGAVRQVVFKGASAKSPSEPASSAAGASSIDIGPDGVIYYQLGDVTGGPIMRFDAHRDPQRDRVGFGSQPTVSPTGTDLAVATDTGISVIDLTSHKIRKISALPDAGAGSALVTDLAWSTDGSTIAREFLLYGADGTFLGVNVDLIDVQTGRSTRVDLGGAAAAMPAFRLDGSLVLASPADASADGGPITGGALVLFDRLTSRVEGQAGLADVTSLDASPDGRWVMASVSGDRLQLVADNNGLGDLGPISAPVGTMAVAIN